MYKQLVAYKLVQTFVHTYIAIFNFLHSSLATVFLPQKMKPSRFCVWCASICFSSSRSFVWSQTKYSRSNHFLISSAFCAFLGESKLCFGELKLYFSFAYVLSKNSSMLKKAAFFTFFRIKCNLCLIFKHMCGHRNAERCLSRAPNRQQSRHL